MDNNYIKAMPTVIYIQTHTIYDEVYCHSSGKKAKYIKRSNFQQPKQETSGKPTLLLVPLVFFRIVVIVTNGVGVVLRLNSYFGNFSEIKKSCI